MAEQLTFDLPSREALGRDAFFVSPANAVALASVDQTEFWPSGKLALIGPAGAGKTHLAHVWASDHDAIIVPGDSLAAADIPALAQRKYVAVEDADRLAARATPAGTEEALFHLHNLLLAEGGRLLITARTAPNHWPLKLPDLASRLQGTSVVTLDAPDDALLGAILYKQFEDRQIAVPATLIPWLIKRMERSAEAAQLTVQRLDKIALREGKPITRTLAAQVLATDAGGDD